jgi:hypothetical protein
MHNSVYTTFSNTEISHVKLSRFNLSLLYSHTDPSNSFINRCILKFVSFGNNKIQTTDVTIPGAHSIDRIHSMDNEILLYILTIRSEERTPMCKALKTCSRVIRNPIEM